MKVTTRSTKLFGKPVEAVVQVGIRPGDDRKFVVSMLNLAVEGAHRGYSDAERTYRKELRRVKRRGAPADSLYQMDDEVQGLYRRYDGFKGVLRGVIEEPAEEPLVLQQFDANQLHDAVLEGIRCSGEESNLANIAYGQERPIPRRDEGFNPYGM